MSDDLHPDDAEIEASRAPLLDHLIELRKRLIVCVAAIILGMILCFAFSREIYLLLVRPFNVAAEILALRQQHHVQATPGFFGPVIDTLQGAKTLFLTLVGLQGPPPGTNIESVKFIFTAPLEFFFTRLKLAAFAAIVLTFPVLAWQVYAFVAPGLYKRERRAFLPFLLAAPVLFLMGAALVYFVILPFVLWFSLSQEVIGAGAVSIQLMPKVSDYLTLVTTLLLAFGLCFQLPVVLTLLGLAGMVSSKMLASGRRYAIVGVFVVAAVVTPPDPISQTCLALPIILLYEISIWCVRLIEFRRRKEEAARDIVPA
jgi:sec-independent protein translocase protein TatC